MSNIMSIENAQRLLKNSDAKERGKLEVKSGWPNEDDRNTISKAARNETTPITLSDGFKYTLRICAHKVKQPIVKDNINPTRCVFVQREGELIPSGHFHF